MKRVLVGVLLLLLMLTFGGCRHENTHTYSAEYKHVEPVGDVPEEFTSIVEENLFHSAVCFSDRVLKFDDKTDGYSIRMYDFYGNTLGEYSGSCDIASYSITALTATSDGGFLFAIGFSERANPDGTWESEKGVFSRVIKCSAKGEPEWNIRLDNYDCSMLRYCQERNGSYYFFGEQQTPETKTIGVHSPTDIHILQMSDQGQIINTAFIAGSDYDSLQYVEERDGQFVLRVHSQSGDGDFASPGSWEITVNADLKVLDMKRAEYVFAEYLGILDGKTISSEDKIAKDFPDGSLTAILDYGDFYLTVSENVTGVYEKTPTVISSLWYYTETVYTAYDNDGKVIWKQAVDSSKNWDAYAAQFDDA